MTQADLDRLAKIEAQIGTPGVIDFVDPDRRWLVAQLRAAWDELAEISRRQKAALLPPPLDQDSRFLYSLENE